MQDDKGVDVPYNAWKDLLSTDLASVSFSKPSTFPKSTLYTALLSQPIQPFIVGLPRRLCASLPLGPSLHLLIECLHILAGPRGTITPFQLVKRNELPAQPPWCSR